jgi:monofunctional biosynthetic peptidoglycan transglycosylase
MLMRAFGRWCVLVLLAGLCLQLFFALRIASMVVLTPQSTSFERSQIWQIVTRQGQLPWRQEWVDLPSISPKLQRAVIASEDGLFAQHGGVWWESLEKAWEKNAKAKALAEQRAQRRPDGKTPPVKIVGGSTITQQLAKNLFLSGERTLLRKGQEMLITLALETCLSKRRILEIYLNSVEWGEGVFGAEAAAQHYFKKSAVRLSDWEAARLAVMLPRPRYFEQRAQSAFLASQAEKIVARMGDVVLP